MSSSLFSFGRSHGEGDAGARLIGFRSGAAPMRLPYPVILSPVPQAGSASQSLLEEADPAPLLIINNDR